MSKPKDDKQGIEPEDTNPCDRCGGEVPENVNKTPKGELLCDFCISMDDVFSDDEEE